jgi:hypothetical protein
VPYFFYVEEYRVRKEVKMMPDITGQVTVMTIDMTPWLWFGYLFCALIGGLASSFANNSGGWLKFHSKGDTVVLGPISDVAIGWAAALGILWAMNPQTLFQLLGMATIAGYGGSSVLRSLVNSLNAATSRRDVDEARAAKETIREESQTSLDKADKETAELEEVLAIVLPHVPDSVLEDLRQRQLIS